MTDEKKKPPGNPMIATYGAGTRFGGAGRPDTQEQAEKGGEAMRTKNSIRGALRRMACFEAGELMGPDGMVSADKLAKAFNPKGKLSDLTMAQIWAIQAAKQAHKDFRAMENLINNVDGKLPNKTVEVQAKSFAQLVEEAQRLEQSGSDE